MNRHNDDILTTVLCLVSMALAVVAIVMDVR